MDLKKHIDELLEILVLEKKNHISPHYICRRLNITDIEGVTKYLLSLDGSKIKISYVVECPDGDGDLVVSNLSEINSEPRICRLCGQDYIPDPNRVSVVFDFTSEFVEKVTEKWENKDSIFLLYDIENSIVESVVDGEGVRLVIFLAGCPHRCLKCHNPQSWDIRNGREVPIAEVGNRLVEMYREGNYQGITFSGGDPLMQHGALRKLIKAIRTQIPSINIWCYTGFVYEQIKDLDVLRYIDVLVDGPYVESRRFPSKKFRGSNNQRILFLKDGVVVKEE